MTAGQTFSIAFMTLGCKVNYYETEKLSARFTEAGAQVVPFDEYADVYVVNTCTVTNIADRKSRKMLHRASRINENAIVVALGCFAEAQEDKLSQDERINLVIGNKDKENAFDIIMEAVQKKYEILTLNESIEDLNDCSQNTKRFHKPEERTRAYVKIQDGCNQFCSYCKIPYVRGRLKSRECESVIEEIEELAGEGYKEVILTGIHVSSYGVDKSECKSFVELEGQPLYELINKIAKVVGIERIRLSSLEPRIITEEFVRKLSQVNKLCPHFHLSMQSGCDATLVRMNRKYTTEDFSKACSILRKYFDNPAITTDVIVGFPGETEEDFEISRQFVKQIAFADIHVFKYSQRSGTKAAVMPGQVDEKVKNERSKRLIDTGSIISKQYADKYIGSIQKCLVEETILINGKKYWIGHNERYLRLAIEYSDIMGDIENCILEVVPEYCTDSNVLICSAKNTLLN